MPSTYSTNLKIELMATGENSGTWGTVTNTNLGTAVEQAIVGYGNPDFTTDANLTITLSDSNSLQAARALVLNVTSTASLTVTRELIVPTIQKQYIVQNNTSGSQSITVKTLAGTGVTIPNGKKMHVYVDGTNVVQMDDFALIFNVDNLTLDGNTLSSTDTNGNIVLAPNGNGDVQLDADTVRIGDSNANATLTTNGTGDLILNTNSGTNSGSITIQDGVDGNIIIAPNGNGQVQITNASLDLATIEVTDIKARDGTAAMSIANGTGVVSITANPVLSGGTANGVLYLNASQVATSGSALTFDGTNLGLQSATNAYAGSRNGATFRANSANGFEFILQSASATAGTSSGFATAVTGNDVYFVNRLDGFYSWITGASGNTERMRLTGSSLNIGGNFTSTNNTLQVTGNAAIGDTLAGPTDGLYVKGNLGVGTNATTSYPVAPNLVVAAATSGGITVRSSSTGYGGVYFADGTTGTEQYRGYIQYSHNVSGDVDSLLVGTAAATRIIVDSAGTVTLRQSSNAANTSVSFNTTVQNALTLDSDGDLGIGTASPAAKLQVAWSSDQLKFTNPSAGFKQIGSSYTGYVSGNDYSAIILGADGSAGGKIQFSTMPSGGALTTAATIDQYGNLGLGVTPSAWGLSGAKAAQVVNASFWGYLNNAYISANNFNDGTGNKYIATGFATRYTQATGQHLWEIAPSGTAGNAITFNQAMTLDASGRLLLGTTGTPSGGTVAAVISKASTTNLQMHSTDGGGALYGGLSGGGAVFYTYTGAVGSESYAERARITSGGDLQIANGNLVMSTSGKGIDFSATASGSGTMTSELLADYEEGTFTPVVSGTTTAGTGTYDYQIGRYTKIGRVVTFTIDVRWTAHTGTGDLTVTGLPFTSVNVTDYNSPASFITSSVSLTAGYIGIASVANNTTSVSVAQAPTGGGSTAAIPMDTFGIFLISGTYEATA